MEVEDERRGLAGQLRQRSSTNSHLAKEEGEPLQKNVRRRCQSARVLLQ